MHLSLFTDTDIRSAARRVVKLAREQMNRMAGYNEEHGRRVADDNPYVDLFVALFRYARGAEGTADNAATMLEVADSVLANPLYAGAQAETERPLLLLVLATAAARIKRDHGERLTDDEHALLD